MNRLTNAIGRAAIIFLYIPIVAVIAYSFNASPWVGQWEGLNLDAYVALFHDDPLIRSLGVSIIVGIGSATGVTLVALLAAIGFAQKRVPGRTGLLAALFIPLVVPEIVIGAALLSLFSALGIPLGYPTLIAGHLLITMPVATLVLIGGMNAIDPTVIEAAYDLGCAPLGVLRRVLVPILRPSLVAAWLLSFTTSLGNIVISTFTNGVGTTTMPLRIYSLLKTGLTPSINALGALLILLTLAIVLAVGIRQMKQIVGDSPDTNVRRSRR